MNVLRPERVNLFSDPLYTNEETGENGDLNGVTNAEIEQINGKTNEIDLDSDEEITAQQTKEVEAVAVENTHDDPPDTEPESAIAEFTIPPPPIDEPEADREPSPEPIREPSPEPVRDPSPEPLRDPSPEPPREPSPEPPREPTPEPPREPTPEPPREPTPEPSPEPVRAPTPEPVKPPTPEPVRAPTPEPVKPPTPEPVRSAPEPSAQTNGAQANGDPIMRMSAKEMRERLAAQKKADAKSKKMGFKDKYDIFQRL